MTSHSTSSTEPVGNPLAAFFTAVRFLTVIPISWRAARDELLFKHAISFFPLVGLLIGIGSYGLVFLSLQLVPASVTAVLLIIYLGGISGFLHMDGLADSADGMLSSRPREKALQIMRDSRTGAMGVIVIVLILLGKYSAFSSISDNSLMLSGALIIPVAGRLAILMSMALLPYAREEGGLGKLFYSSRTKVAALGWICIFFAVCTVFFHPLQALIFLGVVFGTVLIFGYFCKKKLAGATGDTLGAVCELTEMTVAMSLCVL